MLKTADGFFEFLDEIGEADTMERIRSIAAKGLAALGISQFTHIGFNPLSADPRAAEMSTFPLDWVKHYIDNKYVYIDPTIQLARRVNAPFTWEEVDRLETLTPQQRQINLRARDFGMKNVVSIPIHGAQNRFGLFVGKSDESDIAFQRSLDRRKRQLHMVGVSLNNAIQTLLEPEKLDDDRVQLSPRETECLLWTARGKTAWEIGEILTLKESTVNEYIKNAARKLDCNQKTLAVTKAIIQGHISP